MDNQEIEFLDLENGEVEVKNSSKSNSTKKKVILKQNIVLKISIITFMLLAGFICFQYFFGWDIFHIYSKDIIVENKTDIKEAYTTSKGGRNLTLYTDDTFKYMDLDKVVAGKYKISDSKYTLIYDNSVCELTKFDKFMYSNCSLVMTTEDNDYMTSKNKQISKVLYNINDEEFNTISTAFLSYINALPVTKKYPTLKSSRVDSIKDCFSVDSMKTLTCSIDYTVIPNETDVTKSRWLSNGTIVKGAIKKFHYVTFNYSDGKYTYKGATSNL